MEYKTDVVLDLEGNAVAGAVVLVLMADGVTPATIYNAAGTPIDNPLHTNGRGEFSFAAVDGKYFLQVSTGGVVLATRGPVTFFDSEFKQAGPGAVARPLQDKLRETVSVKDFGPVGEGVIDDTAIIQAVIDSLPAGASLHLPRGKYIVQGLKLSGTADDRTGLTLTGDHAVLELPAGVVDKNVAEITSGSDYVVSGITFRGNKGTVTPDGTDLSYRYFNGLYVGANAGKTLSNVRLHNIACENNAYGGIMLGSGPVQPANIGPGVDHVVLTNFTLSGNEFGLAGGAYRHVSMSAATLVNNDIYGLVADDGCYDISVNGMSVKNLSVLGGINACIFLYSCDTVAISGVACDGGKVGILVSTGCGNITVDGYSIHNAAAHGLVVNNSTRVAIGAGTIKGSGQYGASIENGASQVTIASMVAAGNGYDGLRIAGSSTVSVIGGQFGSNNGSGIIAADSTWCTFVGSVCLNNAAGGDLSAAGVRFVNSTYMNAIGVRAFDSALVGSRKQNYGITEEGSSNANQYIGCDFTSNKTADTNIIGNLSMVIGNSANNPDIKLPTGSIYLENGTAAAPSHGFAADAATGLYRTGGGNMGLSVGGALQALVQGQAGAVNYPVLRGSTTTNVAFFPEGAGADLTLTVQGKGAAGGVCMGVGSGRVAFYGGTPAVKPSIAGSRAGNAALADLLTKLAALGLITDGTTA